MISYNFFCKCQKQSYLAKIAFICHTKSCIPLFQRMVFSSLQGKHVHVRNFYNFNDASIYNVGLISGDRNFC